MSVTWREHGRLEQVQNVPVWPGARRGELPGASRFVGVRASRTRCAQPGCRRPHQPPSHRADTRRLGLARAGVSYATARRCRQCLPPLDGRPSSTHTIGVAWI